MTEQDLARTLPARFVLVVVVGGVIGLGILRGPGEIAAVVTEPYLYLALWLLGGLFVLLSTAVVAELLSVTPRSGGAYTLVRRAYGPYAGFVIGWVDWMSFAADLALKAVVIIEFVAVLFPEAAEWRTQLAIVVTTVFAAIQLRGIRLGALIQESATSLIGLVIVVLSMALFFVEAPPAGTTELAPGNNALSDWSLVIATIIFTYDGWLYASYFSGEIKGGAGAAARSCIKGMIIVIALYMLLNAALVKSTDLAALAGSDLAMARALELANYPAAGSLVVIAAILILLSHQNVEYMGGPRILHALATDGLATRRAQKIGKGGNPVAAVVITWLLSVGLILVGGFEFLLLLCVFFFVPLYLAMIVGVLILRKREPDGERPYQAWGHPYSTIVCLTGWTFVTLFQGYVERETALYAVAMVAVSWPVYRYLARK
ncbi:MAG: APC family permease [Gammaproteobacteria bacterium]|nr:APC family permease [Gammaproteobacteria bacterium]